MTTLRVAYFTNHYPKISHSFIRREILALERQGIEVERFALRGWDAAVIDPEDALERDRTRYLLQGGASGLFRAAIQLGVVSPLRFASALRLALRMSRRAARAWPFHLIYLAEACKLVQWLRTSGADHIHAHFGTNSAEVVMLANALSGIPYSVTIHGSEEFDRPAYLGLGEKIRRAAFCVAVTSYTRSQLCRHVEYAHWAKIKVVHCGLDQPFFDLPRTPAPERARLVCVGRFCEQKGHLLLLDAMARVLQEGRDFDLVLAGDGEMRHEIEQLIFEHGLRDRVHITGWVTGDQVKAELIGARALVLASFAEGLPVVIMEAMALRRPVIATAITGIPELVRHGENDWLCPAGSVDALAASITACLSTATADIELMGARGRERVMAHHHIDTEVSKLAKLFSAVAVPVTMQDREGLWAR